MRSYLEFPRHAALALRGLLFDLDDTVLDHGRLAVDTLHTLHTLKAAGLLLFGVTGRPAGWGQVLLRQWPVDGMLTENGSVGFARVGNAIQLVERLAPVARTARRAELSRLALAMKQSFPELVETDDNLCRYADHAFDINESHQVPLDVVLAASEFARQRGARVLRSSIHLHISFEEDDKATGVLRFLNQIWDIPQSLALRQFGFVGDSENDAACFAAFEHSFGVANLRGRPTLPPRYIAALPMGAGFCQIARHLLRLRAKDITLQT